MADTLFLSRITYPSLGTRPFAIVCAHSAPRYWSILLFILLHIRSSSHWHMVVVWISWILKTLTCSILRNWFQHARTKIWIHSYGSFHHLTKLIQERERGCENWKSSALIRNEIIRKHVDVCLLRTVAYFAFQNKNDRKQFSLRACLEFNSAPHKRRNAGRKTASIVINSNDGFSLSPQHRQTAYVYHSDKRSTMKRSWHSHAAKRSSRWWWMHKLFRRKWRAHVSLINRLETASLLRPSLFSSEKSWRLRQRTIIFIVYHGA